MAERIQLKLEVPLPHLIKTGVLEEASRMLDRHAHRFGVVHLQLHLKRVGSQIGCFANLFTDEGRYHVSSSDWDVRKLIGTVMDTLDAQVLKAFDKRSEYQGTAA